MIKPPNDDLVVQCDHCMRSETFSSKASWHELSTCVPPPGWTEVTGILDGRDGPARLGLLNRHLCPTCLPTVGPMLATCGLQLYTVPPQ